MSRTPWISRLALIALVLGLAAPAAAEAVGRRPTAAEIALWDIDVRPDGLGLPAGSGAAARGKTLFADNCEACHGPAGQGGAKDRLVGGQGSLASDHPIKTIGSYWPYATTLFDYIRRAMPYQAPGTLKADEVYALTAYLLSLNGVIAPDVTLDAHTLPKVRMPNRDGFRPDPDFASPPAVAASHAKPASALHTPGVTP